VTSKYVSSLNTDPNGVISVTLRGISGAVDGKIVTMAPMIDATNQATASNLGGPLYGWRCGGTGTTVSADMLPSSCRGN